jgi:hypothetical protein
MNLREYIDFLKTVNVRPHETRRDEVPSAKRSVPPPTEDRR